MISNSLNLNRDVLSMINTNKQAVRKVVGNQQVNRKVRPMFIAAVSASKEITQFSVFLCSQDENEMYFQVKSDVRYLTGW